MGKMTPEEVAILIKARNISKDKGIKKGVSVKEICEHAGISRKTGYQWLQKYEAARNEKEYNAKENAKLVKDHQELLKENDYLNFMNEGRQLAMEIHGFDKFLESKKNTMNHFKKKKQ